LLMILMSAGLAGCQNALDGLPNAANAATAAAPTPAASAAAAPAPVGNNHPPPPHSLGLVATALVANAEKSPRNEDKPTERSVEKRSPSPVVPPSPAQLALELVLREMGLHARLKEAGDEATRKAVEAEIQRARFERQSLYHVLRKEEL